MSGKDMYPCDKYQLDMTAKEFGSCKCGWAKGDHGKIEKPADWKERAERASGLKEEDIVAVLPPPEIPIKRPCGNFVADLNAKEFGMCTCGFKKVEHGDKSTNAEHLNVQLAPQGTGQQKASAAKDDMSATFFASNAGKAVFTGTDDGPCGNFTLNITGEFGKCTHCGYTKEDHKKAEKKFEKEQFIANATAPKKEKEAPPEPPPRSGRATVTNKGKPKPSKKACDNYTVDMAAKNFGDCYCGHSKAEHVKREKKFANNDPDSDEETDVVPDMIEKEEVIVRDGINVCSRFELDLGSSEFKMCLCGFNQQAHQDRKTMTPDEYKKVKELLQKPKEFI